MAESVLNKAPILKSALDSLQIPEPFGSTKDTCTFCLYKKQCEEDKCEMIVQPFKKKNKAKPKKVKPKKAKPPMPEKDDKRTAFLL